MTYNVFGGTLNLAEFSVPLTSTGRPLFRCFRPLFAGVILEKIVHKNFF